MSQETELFDRITVRADIFGGKPLIRGHAFHGRACVGNVGRG